MIVLHLRILSRAEMTKCHAREEWMQMTAQCLIHVYQRRALRDMIVLHALEFAQLPVMPIACGVTEEWAGTGVQCQTHVRQWKDLREMMALHAQEVVQ